MLTQVLIVDDDLKLCTLIQQLFLNNNYNALYATSAGQALTILKYIKVDILVVDYMMPETNGLEFLQILKKNNNNIPSIMLTAVNELEHKLNALSDYADDYLTKPFSAKELVIRVNNIIKRTSKNTEFIQIGDFTFNRLNKELSFNDQKINLSSSEEEILDIFAQHINTILYKEDILQYMNKPITLNGLNALNVAITRLRKKLDSYSNNSIIKTIRGKGLILTV